MISIINANNTQNHMGTCCDHTENSGGESGGGAAGGHTMSGKKGGFNGGYDGNGGDGGGAGGVEGWELKKNVMNLLS
jgi:hypothetical protein